MLEFDHTIRKANGISQLAFQGPEIRVIGVNFGQGKRKSVRVSGVFELSGFRVIRVKMTEKLVQIQGN